MRHAQIRAFHHVAVEGGFSRAAEALRLTQPAISDQVRRLEEEYDVQLFDRRRKQVVLTETGRKLLEITRRLFEVENQALELLSEARALSAGSLRIFADSALHLLHILAPFRKRYPGVRVSVRTGNSAQVAAALLAYEADLGVLGEPPQSQQFDVLNLGSTPIVAFAAKTSAAARRKSMTLAELAQYPLVLREQGSKTRQEIEAAAAQAGIVLQGMIEAEGREAVREIVAAGAGVGVVSEAEFGHDPRVVKIPLTDAHASINEALVCLRDRAGGKLIAAFMEIARKQLQ